MKEKPNYYIYKKVSNFLSMKKILRNGFNFKNFGVIIFIIAAEDEQT